MAIAALVCGCGLLTDPDGLDVTIEELRVTTNGRPQQAVVAGGDVLTVRGTIPKAYACYELGGTARRAADVIVLRVDSHHADRCLKDLFDITAHSDYRADVEGLDPGSYRVSVLHEKCCSFAPPDTLVHSQVVQIR